jgi:hypothetical protein
MTSVHKFKDTDVNLHGVVNEDEKDPSDQAEFDNENDSYRKLSRDYGFEEEDNYSKEKIIKRKRRAE